MSKKLKIGAAAFVVFAAVMGFMNYQINNSVHLDASRELDDAMQFTVTYNYYVLPNSIVINLQDVLNEGDAIMATRLFFETSKILKERNFSTVYFARHGRRVMKIDGDAFQEIGQKVRSRSERADDLMLQNLYFTDGTRVVEKPSDSDFARIFDVLAFGKFLLKPDSLRD